MANKIFKTEITYTLPNGFECPICMKASMNIKGVNLSAAEIYYTCIVCEYMITIKKYIK